MTNNLNNGNELTSDEHVAKQFSQKISDATSLEELRKVRFEYCFRFEAAINSFGKIPYSHLSIALLSDLAGKATECYATLGYVDQGFLERAGFSGYVISYFIHQINFNRGQELAATNSEECAA